MSVLLRSVQSILLGCILAVPSLLSATWDFVDVDGEKITFDWVKPNSSLVEEEKVFIKSFTEAYKNLSLSDLGVEDKSLFLKDAFSDVRKDFSEERTLLLTAAKNGKVIGFVSFKPTEKATQMYIGQLAVDPAYWRKGIGKELVFGISHLQPELTKLVAIGRRKNGIGRNFFLKIGFTECAYMHPGYNPEKYVGYEYSIQK